MIFGMLARLSRVRMTLGYVATLVAVSVALVVLGPRVHDRVVGLASTNLHNLARGHLGTLFGSAFVTDAGPMWFWLPGLVCLLALAELIWRSGRLALVFVTGHVGATLLVATGLTAAIEFGWLPLSISRASDVGMSYGAVAVLGALTAAIPRRWRPVWIGWWVPVGIAAAITGRRLHRRRARHRAGAGHAGGDSVNGTRPLDAGALCAAGCFCGLRMPAAGAQQLGGGCRGHRRRDGRCGGRPDHPLAHGAPVAAGGSAGTGVQQLRRRCAATDTRG